MPNPPRVPAYCHHKPSNRAFCKVAGKFVYLEPYGSKISRTNYARVVERVLSGRAETAAAPSPSSLTVRQLADRYSAHAGSYYVKNDEPTNEAAMVAKACQRAAEIFGNLPACDFGPLCLETVSNNLVALRSIGQDSSNSMRGGQARARRGRVFPRWATSSRRPACDVFDHARKVS